MCAGTATPKASIEQGKINPEKIYIKSTDLPAFALGNMKAADEAARAKYKHDDQGRPVFYELNAKTNLWMNSENIKGVDGFKSDYEIKQEALAVQKNKLKKTYQDKIDEQLKKYKEKLAAHEALKKKLADLERQADGDFTDEEKKAFCAKIKNPEGCPTKAHLEEMEKIAESELDKNEKNLEAQIKASEEQLKKDAEAANKIIAENQEKINEIDAAKDAEALGKVKANQDQDLANKKAEAAEKQVEADRAEENAKQKEAEVEDLQRKARGEVTDEEIEAYCEDKQISGVGNCQAVAADLIKKDAEAELNGQYGEGGKLAEAEEAKRKADAAKQDADQAKAAADAAEKKIVDDLKNENETIKNTLYEHDRFGEAETIKNEDKTMNEKVAEAVEKEMNSDKAKLAIHDQVNEDLKKNLEYNDLNDQIKAKVSDCYNVRKSYAACTDENIAGRDPDVKKLVTRRDEIYENAKKGAEKDYRDSITERHRTELKKENDLAKEVIASSTGTADVTGVSFNKPKDNKRPLPSDEGTKAITSGKQN